MKKLLLSIIFALITSVTAFAANLNPFAYGLSSSLSADQSTLTVHYSLNSTATSVKVVVMNGNTVVAEKDCSSLGLTKGNYTTTISTSDFPTDAELTWKVEVKGTSVAQPTVVSTMHSLYHPSSIDIDNNPNSDRFGTIFCIEGLNNLHSSRNPDSSKYSSYVSYGSGAGLYLFDASFTHQKTENGANGYNGGVAFNDLEYSIGGKTAYAPRRVRLTNDGRIFISTQVLVGSNKTVLWEVTSFQEPWKHVMAGNVDNCTDNAFYAAPNVGFDVYGSGNNLKLAMLSGTTSAFSITSAGNFRLSTYSYNGVDAPELEMVDHQDKISGTITVAYDATQVEYDNEGGFWLCQGRGAWEKENEKKYPSLIHFNKNGNVDLVERRLDRRGGGIAYNRDYSQIIISGKYEGTVSGVFNSYNTPNCTKGWATVYSVTSTDAPSLAFQYSIDMTNISTTSSSTLCNINDFAWDYAGNVYAVSHIGEKIAAWAMPYSGTVSTPAATKYTFEITNPNYDLPEKHLAPFAYDLRKTIEGDGRVKLSFMLNAHARKVEVWLEDKEAGKEYLLRSYPNKYSTTDFVPYHSNGYGTIITADDIENLGIPCSKDLTWRVDVYGKDIAAPNCVKSYSFYHPSAVDIDNNPKNKNFGLILTNEAMEEIYHKTGFESYHSYDLGAGIYAFTPAFRPIMNENKNGFDGGVQFTKERADDSTKSAYAPRRIRISKDGRIFATSLNTNGKVLWEINKNNLNEWTEVISGTPYAINTVQNSKKEYIGGPNIGFDVSGEGDGLKLLMLSGIADFKCCEYNLGEGTSWNERPTKELDVNNSVVNYTGSSIEYDEDGGFWICQYRDNATDKEPSLVHFNVNGVLDYKETVNSRMAGGIRFSNDFERIIIAGVDAGTPKSKKATIYKVSKDSNGNPLLTNPMVVDCSVVGNNLNDFAWDYAGNLYVCGNSNEKLAAYVMPRSKNDVVSTPARDEYVVNLRQPVPCVVAYNLTYTPNGAKKTYDFSFYANTQPTNGTIRFYKNNNTKDLLYTQDIASPKKGTNTVSIPMATLDEKLNLECDVIWEIELSAPSSEVFGKIYQSDPLNTAYATIDVNPESDYFGQIYATNQEIHTFAAGENGTLKGEICVWAPDGANGEIYHTIKENYKLGINLVGRLCVAPDGKLYISDNGRHGGLYVMNPKDYSTVSFFEGCTQGERSRWFAGDKHVGAPSSCPNIYWTGENTAQLFVTRTEYHTETNIGSQGLTADRHNEGYFVYPLAKNGNGWSKDWNNIQTVDITEDNLYQNDFSIVGTSHGAWLCQHRYNEMDVFEARSLMFYDKNGVRQYCSDDNDAILGSAGAAVAINKEETRLAMSSGNGGIMFFSIEWSGDKPTLKHEYTSPLNNNYVVTSLNFDYAGNLVATVGDTYNDNTDKHRMIVFTTPKVNNTITVPARFSQRVAALYADERMKVHFDENITNNSPYQTVDVFRRLQAGMCNTICLPFSIENKVGTPYEKTKIFAFTGVTQGNDQVELQFSEVNAMQAGVPYLIQPENDITDLLRFSPVQVNTDFNNEGLSVTHDGITYYGTINPKYLDVDQNYLFLVANNRLATASEGGEMLGLRGYFTVNGAPTKAIISFKEGVAAGVTSTIGQPTDGVQKILQDQQILIIRDGETYNILGEHINTK